MQITTCETEEMYEKVARSISDAINTLLAQGDEIITMALCGGRSTAAICEYLIKENIEWGKVHIFLVDERMVELEDEDANYGILEEHLVLPLVLEGKLDRHNVHPFAYLKDEDDFGIGDYQAELQQIKSQFDIVLLSSGEDGHVAALYPNHHTVLNQEQFFFAFDDSPKPPAFRMTSSRKLILASKYAFLVMSGESKLAALRNFLDESISLEGCPAKIVNYIPSGGVFTDIDPSKL